MSDRWAVALALAAAAGAWASRPFPLAPVIALIAVAFVVKRPVLLCVGAALLTSTMGARAWAGLDPPRPQPVDGTVTLVTDPDDAFGAVRAEVRLDGRRFEAWA